MANKTDRHDSEQTEPNAEEQTTSIESKKTKSHLGKVMFILILFLLMVGGISYYLTPVILPYLSETSVVKENQIISVEAKTNEPDTIVDKDVFENPVIEATAHEIPLVQDAVQEPTPILTIEQETNPEAVIPESKINTNPSFSTMESDETNSMSAIVLSKETNKELVVQKGLLLKIIQLYETFQQDGQCRPLLEELITLSELHPVIQNSVNELLTICLENPMSEQIQSAFYKNKKRAVLRILQNSNTPMMAYVKVLPYLIFDIRKKEAFNETPMDTLYRLQAAVEANNFAQIIELVNQLPDNVQPTLYDLKQSAIHENTIYQVLQNLIQTLTTGGNDE